VFAVLNGKSLAFGSKKVTNWRHWKENLNKLVMKSIWQAVLAASSVN